MNWSISKISENKITVIPTKLGNFKTFAQAVDTAVKMAKSEKLYLDIFSEESILLESLNYTKTLSIQEIFQKSLSDLKLTYAEKTVAKIELDKRKKDYKDCSDLEQKEQLKELYINAKWKYKHKKKRIKYAKFRYKMAKKTFKKDL
ncbi:hypothetical protein [Mycoplasma sp. HU2014]|uniref:hypothetical protein n=1 Tax=Mycoplasma sp. HU2014 TaxID=1664275 RepID=UPI00067D0EB2|nr:hypothetical protein [Mycoplasma sp. HU2014]KNG79102.1 hypothetical protein AB668_04010 [Mycoplasma sp. HU2014]